MHPTIDLNELKSEMEALGHTVTNICNIRQTGTKTPMPLFYVERKTQEYNKEVYKINFLLNTRVKFEPPRPKREIPQCKKCQRYGHTKKFCYHSPRCVKCAGDHHTSQCTTKKT